MIAVWLLAGCAHHTAGPVVLRNGRLPGQDGPVDLEIRDGRFAGVGSVTASGVEEIDLHGATIAPAFVDSHVHLAYYPVGPELAAAGVAAAVDLAAPLPALATVPAGSP